MKLTALAVVILALGISLGCASGGSERDQYEVNVQFGESATQEDIDEAGALLQAFDEDLDFVIMEIFPPIGKAVMAAETADFCQKVETELGAKSYVDDVSCGPHVETGQADPDEPVSTDND